MSRFIHAKSTLAWHYNAAIIGAGSPQPNRVATTQDPSPRTGVVMVGLRFGQLVGFGAVARARCVRWQETSLVALEREDGDI